ncbi:MAG: hypothetical protein ACI4SJ_06740 [Candidatus Avispirillum sp.]
MLKEFLCWLFNAEHIFTFVTVILSGIISWIISAAYYRKTNRNALRQNIIYPIKRKLRERCSLNNYKEIETLSKVFETRYLSRKERESLNNLLAQYKAVCDYDRSYAYAECVYSYFCKTLARNNIDINVFPIYHEDDIVGYDVPTEVYYLIDDIKHIIDNNPPEYDPEYEKPETVEQKIIPVLKYYCKKYFSDKEIEYFSDTTVYEIYKGSSAKSEWEEKIRTYHLVEEKFLNMKICN